MTSSVPPELTAQEVEEMREWFRFFDKNSDGQLDRAELRKVFHSVGWEITEEQFEQTFKSVDTDGNGTISYEEYLKLLNLFRKDKNLERAELIESFRHYDKDRSGTIDRNELHRLLMSKGILVGERDKGKLDQLLALADKNKDGVIDIEEFISLMMDTPWSEVRAIENE